MVATVLTVYGIETFVQVSKTEFYFFDTLQQYLPFTVYNENTHKSLVTA